MKSLITLAVLIVLPVAAPVAAEPPAGSIAIAHGDLDLTSEAGRAALDLRIHHAASEACGLPSPADPRGAARAEQCRQQVLARARPQRDAAMTQARSGERRRLAGRR